MRTVIRMLMGLIVGYLIGVILGAIVAFVFGFEDAARWVAIACAIIGLLIAPTLIGRVQGGRREP